MGRDAFGQPFGVYAGPFGCACDKYGLSNAEIMEMIGQEPESAQPNKGINPQVANTIIATAGQVLSSIFASKSAASVPEPVVPVYAPPPAVATTGSWVGPAVVGLSLVGTLVVGGAVLYALSGK